MIVYVCRHAEAVSHERADGIDENRWLSRQGQSDAVKVAHYLKERGDSPALLVSSPHVRAVQTAERLDWALESSPEREVFSELSLGSPLGPVLARLESLGEKHASVMVVGHEPMMTFLGSTLIGRRITRPWPTAGILRVDFDGAVLPGTGRDVFFLSPAGFGKS